MLRCPVAAEQGDPDIGDCAPFLLTSRVRDAAVSMSSQPKGTPIARQSGTTFYRLQSTSFALFLCADDSREATLRKAARQRCSVRIWLSEMQHEAPTPTSSPALERSAPRQGNAARILPRSQGTIAPIRLTRSEFGWGAMRVHFFRPPIISMNGLEAARILTAALYELCFDGCAGSVFPLDLEPGAVISNEIALRVVLDACNGSPTMWFERAQ